MRRPLDGIRVLDLTIWQQGTYASAVLADLGADVVKIEEPVSGDPGRHSTWRTPVGLNSYFEALNRGKRSLILDLKHPAGRDVFLRLAKAADVFISNFRLPAIERLGLTYDAVSAANPQIVYVQASGYGALGDGAGEFCMDILAQARGGFCSMNGAPDGPPLPAQVPIADQVGAMNACIGALTGLVSRAATGRGMKVDTSLLGSQLAMQSFNITDYLLTGRVRQRRERAGATPFWRLYRGGDDKWFVIGMLFDRSWPEFVATIERPDLLADERFATFRQRVVEHAPALIEILDAIFATAPARDWVARLNACGMFAQPAQDYAEVAADPQVLANGYIHEVPRPGHDPVRMVGIGLSIDDAPVTVRSLAPQHGEHTEAVLLEAGYTWDEIAALRDEGVVGPVKPPDESSAPSVSQQ
jgi:crotonobetainyl-CoA:carnitine CoA-transferase CaiB-like acyl-CoA transferase